MSINIVENGVLKNVSGGGSAIRDGDGNIITDTYARKDHIINSSVVTEPGFMADARLLNPSNAESPLRNSVNSGIISLSGKSNDGDYFTKAYGRNYYEIRNGICFFNICVGAKTIHDNINYPYELFNEGIFPSPSLGQVTFEAASKYPLMQDSTLVVAISEYGVFVSGGYAGSEWHEFTASYPIKINLGGTL